MYHYLFIFLGFVSFFLFLYKKLIGCPETYIPETNQKQPQQTNKQQPIDSKQQTTTLV